MDLTPETCANNISWSLYPLPSQTSHQPKDIIFCHVLKEPAFLLMVAEPDEPRESLNMFAFKCGPALCTGSCPSVVLRRNCSTYFVMLDHENVEDYATFTVLKAVFMVSFTP